MTALLNAFGFALVTTALFALRFGEGTRRSVLAAYFAFFFALEWAAAHFFFPQGAMGLEVGVTCIALSIPVLVATWLVRRTRARDDPSDPAPPTRR